MDGREQIVDAVTPVVAYHGEATVAESIGEVQDILSQCGYLPGSAGVSG